MVNSYSVITTFNVPIGTLKVVITIGTLKVVITE